MVYLLGTVFLLAAVTLISWYCYRICFYVPKQRHEDVHELPGGEQYAPLGQKLVDIALIMDQAEYQAVEITSFDGLQLRGKLYNYYPGAPVILAFHGYRSMAVRDCAGAFALAQKLDFNILVPDQRAHGASQGQTITFGIRERQDCLSWIRYARQRFGDERPLILSGISMGAATVLMASDLELPDSLVCILADCPYTSPSAIIRKVAADMKFPPKLVFPFIRIGAWLFGGLKLTESSAIGSVRNAKVPILLIHGEDDRFVPCDMSRALYHSCSAPVKLYTFPEAGHGLCYILDPERYEKICVDFLWEQKALVPYLEQSDFAVATHEK